jgi:N-acetylglucosaminyldiphosphoundecaprenol N-acetyl-beta-D-mannosaminyltransferase
VRSIVPHEHRLPRVRANLLGVGIDAIDMPIAVERILADPRERSRGYVCVTGVHGIMEAQRDERLRAILNGSFMTTPDGMPTVWIGRAQGRSMSRVYGPDLMLEVCSAGVARGVRHFFYGGTEGVAQSLRERLTARIPGLDVVGVYTPPFRALNDAEERELVKLFDSCQPDIVWVGLSTPKQERFMSSYHRRFRCGLMIGVGAAFDMHTGRTTQAPKWMQRSGFEWLYRLATEPRRLWKRYLLNNPAFLCGIVAQWLHPSRYSLPR